MATDMLLNCLTGIGNNMAFLIFLVIYIVMLIAYRNENPSYSLEDLKKIKEYNEKNGPFGYQ